MKRKHILSGFAMIAGVAAMSSVAYACTTQRGQLSATGNGGGTVTQAGNNTVMHWCGETGATTISKPLGTVHVEVTPYAGNPTSTLPGCIAGNQLPDSGELAGFPAPVALNPTQKGLPTYYGVTWADNAVQTDCMHTTNVTKYTKEVHEAVEVATTSTVNKNGVMLGAELHTGYITITNGSGSGDYYIDSSLWGSPTLAHLCVSDFSGGFGTQVSFTFI